MITRHDRKGVTWVDLETPTSEELRSVMEEFNIANSIEEEVISPTPFSLILSCPAYLYLILHFPKIDPDAGAHGQEVDFIIGKKFLITIRYEVIDSVHSLHRVLETEDLLNLPEHRLGADSILERLLRHLYGGIREQPEFIARKLDRVEADIFAGRERKMVRQISDVARILLHFDTSLARHTEPLKAFLEDLSQPGFFGKAFENHAAHIQAEHDHSVGLIAGNRAIIRELRMTNDSLLSSSQNEIIKKLAIISFVTFPLSLMAGIFGMNTENTPIIGIPGDFWIVISVMSLIAAGFFVFFKKRDWL